jgi:suppressor for copper-sensitivity B
VTVFWLSNILLNFYNYYFILLSFLLFVVLSYRQKLFFLKKTITSLVLLVLFFSSSLKIFEQNSNLRNDKDWLNFFETDIDKIVQQDKIVFLDITADWCATCQFNKINVLDSNTVNKAFKDNNVTLIRADWTKPSTKINLFLEKYDRFGIPFNAFFSVNFPDGILLSELLSEKDILKTINQINNE